MTTRLVDAMLAMSASFLRDGRVDAPPAEGGGQDSDGTPGPGSPQVTPSTRRAPRGCSQATDGSEERQRKPLVGRRVGQEAWERPGTSILARPSLCGSGSPGAPASTYSLSAWSTPGAAPTPAMVAAMNASASSADSPGATSHPGAYRL